MIHVAAAIVSGAVFTVGGVVTVLYLLQDRWERRGAVNALSRRLPPSEQLDQSAYRLFAFVFPLWTFAIMAGAIWAENAWGKYWSWDPKETWALVTWLVFACYLHARATAGWKGRRAAYIALAGLSCFVFNYFGVNIWFSGLHSYGGLPQAAEALLLGRSRGGRGHAGSRGRRPAPAGAGCWCVWRGRRAWTSPCRRGTRQRARTAAPPERPECLGQCADGRRASLGDVEQGPGGSATAPRCVTISSTGPTLSSVPRRRNVSSPAVRAAFPRGWGQSPS